MNLSLLTPAERRNLILKLKKLWALRVSSLDLLLPSIFFFFFFLLFSFLEGSSICFNHSLSLLFDTHCLSTCWLTIGKSIYIFGIITVGSSHEMQSPISCPGRESDSSKQVLLFPFITSSISSSDYFIMVLLRFFILQGKIFLS